MRAQRARRSIWIINAGLGLALIALAGWYAADVHAGVSRIRATRVGEGIPHASAAVRRFTQRLGGAGAAVIAPSCERGEVNRVFRIDDRDIWLPFVGPIQPPHEPPPGDDTAESDPGLSSLVRVRMLITGERPLVVLVPHSGPSLFVQPGEAVRVPGLARTFDLLRIARVERSVFHVIFVERGTQAEQVLVVRTHDAPDANDPVRPEGSAPDGSAPAAEPTARSRTQALPDVDHIEITQLSRGRVRVRVPGTLRRALRRDTAGEILADVKTREVELPGGTRGVQLAHIGVEAQLVHKVSLKNGDTLLRINGTPTPTRGAVAKVLRDLPAETRRVTVTVDRAGQQLSYEIETHDRSMRR